MAVVAVGTGGDADYHRRFVLRTVGDVLWAYYRRFVTRTGGDKKHHQRFVLQTGGDKPVQYKTPTPPSSYHLSSPTRRPHLSPPLLLPDFAEILMKPHLLHQSPTENQARRHLKES